MSSYKQLFSKLNQEIDFEVNFVFLRIADIICKRAKAPWLWPSFIFNLLPIGQQHKKQLEILHGFSRNVFLFLLNILFLIYDV